MAKNKFEEMLTLNGKALLSKRAQNLSIDVEESFNDQKRALQKKMRALDGEIAQMEDLSVKTADSLTVGDELKGPNAWVKRRFEIELEKRDIQIELDVIRKLIDEYFSEPEGVEYCKKSSGE